MPFPVAQDEIQGNGQDHKYESQIQDMGKVFQVRFLLLNRLFSQEALRFDQNDHEEDK